MSTAFDEFLQELELEHLERKQKAIQEGRLEGRVEGRREGRLEGRVEGRWEGRLEGRREGRSERLEEYVLILLEEGWPLAKISSKMKEPIELVKTIQQKFIRQGRLTA